jgi:hypothetical protein
MFNGNTIQVSALLSDGEAVDRLIRALEANKALLPERPKEKEPSAVD